MSSLDGQDASPQTPLGGSVQYGEVGSEISYERLNELEKEKLFERCVFINSLAEKLGN